MTFCCSIIRTIWSVVCRIKIVLVTTSTEIRLWLRTGAIQIISLTLIFSSALRLYVHQHHRKKITANSRAWYLLLLWSKVLFLLLSIPTEDNYNQHPLAYQFSCRSQTSWYVLGIASVVVFFGFCLFELTLIKLINNSDPFPFSLSSPFFLFVCTFTTPTYIIRTIYCESETIFSRLDGQDSESTTKVGYGISRQIGK